MTLTGKQKNYLRGIAHNLNPVVMIGGKGLTEAVMKEIELALDQHELIKIKLPSNEKAEKVAILAQITSKSKSEPVQLIGRVGVVYRPNKEPKLALPSI
ncbi:ribosome assembly RNA-binding protein YhbY [Arenicella xantha]|uniref:RNA-binding protein n=1 Tax=Arenicella xantha TaxID=644221 RepID=A0A395JKZ4_9GAMM|nr:ribosome assembly RNA-binding protein YhbY [Arenicella xantha]RBP51466.1 RNA-binding protein [Arenicella xantha]